MRQALADLPAEQRAALVLVDVQGYPVAEAAEMLGVAEGTIKSRCARGRARMAIALGHLRRGDDVTRAGNGNRTWPPTQHGPPDAAHATTPPAAKRGKRRPREGPLMAHDEFGPADIDRLADYIGGALDGAGRGRRRRG